MRALGVQTKIAIEVYGPETHLTSIVAMAFNQPVASLDYENAALRTVTTPLPASTLDDHVVSEAESKVSSINACKAAVDIITH